MKLFCRDEMQRLEMAAVAAGVPLSQLMDNAGAAVAQEVERRCRPVGGKRAVVLCGKGNNGGAWPAGWCWPRASPPPI